MHLGRQLKTPQTTRRAGEWTDYGNSNIIIAGHVSFRQHSRDEAVDDGFITVRQIVLGISTAVFSVA
jgi:hypothetical protein